LRAGAVHRSRVKSDAKGNLPRTNLWRPDRPGVYDVIVDYDNDGRFSFALDGLSAFVVRKAGPDRKGEQSVRHFPCRLAQAPWYVVFSGRDEQLLTLPLNFAVPENRLYWRIVPDYFGLSRDEARLLAVAAVCAALAPPAAPEPAWAEVDTQLTRRIAGAIS